MFSFLFQNVHINVISLLRPPITIPISISFAKIVVSTCWFWIGAIFKELKYHQHSSPSLLCCWLFGHSCPPKTSPHYSTPSRITSSSHTPHLNLTSPLRLFSLPILLLLLCYFGAPHKNLLKFFFRLSARRATRISRRPAKIPVEELYPLPFHKIIIEVVF